MNHPGPKAVPMGERIQPRPKRRKRRKFDHGEPIWRIDTRPLVFVFMFVALVFLFGATQIRQHAILFDMPYDHDIGTEARGITIHRITISDQDEISFDGTAMTMSELLDRLNATRRAEIRPHITLEPSGDASYDRSVRVLALVHAAGLNDWAFCIDGLEKHSTFGSDFDTDNDPNIRRVWPDFISCDPEAMFPVMNYH